MSAALPATAAEFRAWRARMGFTQAEAAAALGKRVLQIKRYERAADEPGGDQPHAIPRTTALACAALEADVGRVLTDFKLLGR